MQYTRVRKAMYQIGREDLKKEILILLNEEGIWLSNLKRKEHLKNLHKWTPEEVQIAKDQSRQDTIAEVLKILDAIDSPYKDDMLSDKDIAFKAALYQAKSSLSSLSSLSSVGKYGKIMTKKINESRKKV